MALLSLLLEKRFTRRTWRAVLVAVLGSLGCYVLLTPALLRDPAAYLTYVLRNSYSFSRWNNTVLFCGRVIDLSWERPPFYYLPVMIALTMPLVQLGGGLVLRRCARQKASALCGQENFAAVLCLSCWLLPLLGMMVMRVRVYNGWRHAYFLFFPMMAMAGWALGRIRTHLARRTGLRQRRGGRTVRAHAAQEGSQYILQPFLGHIRRGDRLFQRHFAAGQGAGFVHTDHVYPGQ